MRRLFLVKGTLQLMIFYFFSKYNKLTKIKKKELTINTFKLVVIKINFI